MEEVFVYKCPNCGGKVEFKDSKWHCSYCNNVYDSLFANNDTKPLTDYKNEPIKLFSFTCSKCSEKYISKNDNESCPKCHEASFKSGIPFNVLNILDVNVPINVAQKEFQKKLGGYKKEDIRVYNNKFVLQYISCDSYNGIVELSYGDYALKYVLAGLLIPNIEYEDYSFMYELACYGCYNSQNIDKDLLVDKIISNSNKEIITEVKDYRQNIINECIKTFANKYEISDIDSIKVDESIEIDRGLFIPFYTSSCEFNNETYHQYVFGNENAYLLKKDFKGYQIKEEIIIELQKDENACIKKEKYKKVLKTFDIIIKMLPKLFFLLIAFSMIAAVLDIVEIFHYLFLFVYLFMFLLILGGAVKFEMHIRYQLYEEKIKISKEELFNLIVNNSKSIKVIKVRK